MQRMTRQRSVILDELKQLRSHPTATELYECVRRRLPHVSLGTIYRNLDILERAQLVRKVDGAGGQCRYDGDLSQHLHVRCVECGRVDDIDAAPGDLLEEIIHGAGYRLTGFRLEFEGLCPSCQGPEKVAH